MPLTRLYHVAMKNKKQFLVEAISKEQAIQRATGPLVKDVTIPAPLEVLRLQSEGAILLTVDTPPNVVDDGEEDSGGEGGEQKEGQPIKGEKPAVDLPPPGDGPPSAGVGKKAGK